MKIAIALCLLFLTFLSNAQVVDFKSGWAPNSGTATTITKFIEDTANRKMYFVGGFTQFGWNTGGGGVIDTNTFLNDKRFPVINGPVTAAIADGSGGWFIGGSFTMVGNSIRYNLARINKDGTLHPWNPTGSVSTSYNVASKVYSMKINGGKVWVGGFGISNGFPNNGAFFSVDTGVNPVISSVGISTLSGSCYSIDISGTSVVIGGLFTNYNGNTTPRSLMALNISNGSLLWNASVSYSSGSTSQVTSVSINNSVVYFFGGFDRIGTAVRNNLGAVNLSNGGVHSWNPTNTGGISGLKATSSGVYVYGSFVSLGGETRNRIGKLNLTTGAIDAWTPTVSTLNIKEIFIQGNSLYYHGINKVGLLSTISGVEDSRSNTLVGGVNSWSVLCLSQGKLFVGSEHSGMQSVGNTSGLVEVDLVNQTARNLFYSVSGNRFLRNAILVGRKLIVAGTYEKLFCFDLDSNKITNEFQGITINTYINDFALVDQKLLCVGDFSLVNGISASRAVLVNLQDKSIDYSTIRFGSSVSAVKKVNQKLFFVGNFTTINGISRNRAACFDWETKSVTSFNPNLNDSIFALEYANGNIYLGGKFTQVNIPLIIRQGMAVFDTLGNLLSDIINITWQKKVSALAKYGNYLYIAGDYSAIMGSNRNGCAEYDLLNKQLTSFNPRFEAKITGGYEDRYIEKLQIVGNQLLASGLIFFYRNSANSLAKLTIANLASFHLQIPKELSTDPADSIRSSWAKLNGQLITSPAIPSALGFVISTTSMQKWNGANGALSSKTTIGSFSVRKTGLSPNQIYFYRAFGIIGNDTIYGSELSFTTPSLGNFLDDPILISLPYSGSIQTSNAGFSNSYSGLNNQPSPDVFFRFTTPNFTDTLQISTCSSAFDTYLHLLDSVGNRISSNSQDGPLCAGNKASIVQKILPNSTYFLVVEGDGNASGMGLLTVVSKIFYLWDPIDGAGPKYWSDPRNWAPGTAPLPGFSIVLPGNGSDSLVVDQDASVGNVVFQGSNQNLVLNQYNLSISGTIFGSYPNSYFLTRGDGSIKVFIPPGLEIAVPVGESTMNSLTIQNNTGILDSFEIRVDDAVLHRGHVGVPLNQPKVDRTWHINKGSGHSNLGNGVRMKFFVPSHLWPSTISNLGLFHYQSNQGWELVQNGTVSKTGDTIEISNYRGGFSPFYWGDQGNALPVTLGHFEVNCTSSKAEVHWETVQEINVSHFEILFSQNGKTWEKKGVIKARGRSSSVISYQYSLLEERLGWIKLVEIDFDGSIQELGIRKLNCNGSQNVWTLFPNPGQSICSFFPSSRSGNYRMFNQLGQEVRSGHWNNLERIEVSTADLPIGLYYVQLEGNDEIVIQKWVKNKG